VAAWLFGPLGYALAKPLYESGAPVFVELPVCGGCRSTAGKNVEVLGQRGTFVVLGGVAEQFAADVVRKLEAELDRQATQFERKLLRANPDQPRTGAPAEPGGGFDWSSLG
jgi:hypothetical protein